MKEETENLNEQSNVIKLRRSKPSSIDLIKQRFTEMSASTSLHGYCKIFQTKFLVIKILWVIILLAAMNLCVFSLIKSVNDYYGYEVISKTRIINQTPMTMPTIALCNNNPFANKNGRDVLMNFFRNVTRNSKLQSFNDLAYRNGVFNDDEYDKTIENATIFKQLLASDRFSDSDRKLFGFNFDEFVINCYFNQEECGREHFSWFYDATYGNCFKFNSGFDEQGRPVPLLKVITRCFVFILFDT